MEITKTFSKKNRASETKESGIGDSQNINKVEIFFIT